MSMFLLRMNECMRLSSIRMVDFIGENEDMNMTHDIDRAPMVFCFGERDKIEISHLYLDSCASCINTHAPSTHPTIHSSRLLLIRSTVQRTLSLSTNHHELIQRLLLIIVLHGHPCCSSKQCSPNSTQHRRSCSSC